jgi:hypothetical protein
MNAEIRSLLVAAVNRTIAQKGAGYLARPVGSTVDGLDVSNGDEVAAFLLSHDWEEVDPGTAGYGSCRYFRAEIGDGFTGKEGICFLSDLNDEELSQVRVAKGHHGNLEFQLAGQAPRPTRVMHIFVGSYESWPNGEVNEATVGVISWYPGRLTPPVDIAKATVKFVR